MKNTKEFMQELRKVATEVTMRSAEERKTNDVGEAILARFPNLEQRLQGCCEEAVAAGYLPEVAQFVFFGAPALPDFAPDRKLRRLYGTQPGKLRFAADMDVFVALNIYWAAGK